MLYTAVYTAVNITMVMGWGPDENGGEEILMQYDEYDDPRCSNS
jgi:hypothetical protein